MGDMAVSNSIGSNIFDVLLGLGFPWALRTLIVSYGSVVKPNVFSPSYFCHSGIVVLWFCECLNASLCLKVTINSKGLVYSVILLLASVTLTVSAHVESSPLFRLISVLTLQER